MASRVISSDTRDIYAVTTGIVAKDPSYANGEILISNQFIDPNHPEGDFVCVTLFNWTSGEPVEVTPLYFRDNTPVENPFVVAPNTSAIIELPGDIVPTYYEIRIGTEVDPDVIANIFAYNGNGSIIDGNTFRYEDLSPQALCIGTITTTVTADCSCSNDQI